jgi:hypothetical protein
MQTHYLSDSVSVNTTGIKLKPSFDIKKFAFYTEDGNYLVRMRCMEIWGPWIHGFPYVEMSDEMPCVEIEIKAVASTIQLYYYIRGEK